MPRQKMPEHTSVLYDMYVKSSCCLYSLLLASAVCWSYLNKTEGENPG